MRRLLIAAVFTLNALGADGYDREMQFAELHTESAKDGAYKFRQFKMESLSSGDAPETEIVLFAHTKFDQPTIKLTVTHRQLPFLKLSQTIYLRKTG